MSSVYDRIAENGPCLSSDLVATIVEEEGITPVAARKRVSRADERIGRVYNLFPRNTVFLYIKEYFGSDEYWLKLTEALLEANAAYGKALAALLQRGGIVAEPFFHIACGAPQRLKKHISSSTMIEQLLRTQLVERQYIPGSGNCIALAKGPGMYDGAVATLRARTAAEDIFLAGFETAVSSSKCNSQLTVFKLLVARSCRCSVSTSMGNFQPRVWRGRVFNRSAISSSRS